MLHLEYYYKDIYKNSDNKVTNNKNSNNFNYIHHEIRLIPLRRV